MEFSLNWRRLVQVQSVPPSQAALALGMIGLGQAWALYLPEVGVPIRPFLCGFWCDITLTCIGQIRHQR